MIEVHNLTFGYSATEDGQILKGVDFAANLDVVNLHF